MANNHVQNGHVLEWTNTSGSTVTSGTPIVMGDMVGVALVDIPDLDSGSVAVKEVWKLPKLTGNAIGQGSDIYLTPGGSITPTETGNTYAGKAAAPAALDDTKINVLLNV